MAAKHAQFKCAHGYSHSYGKRGLRHFGIVEMAMKAMAEYCEEHNINIVDLFSRFDSDGSMSVSHDEFKLGLKVSWMFVFFKLSSFKRSLNLLRRLFIWFYKLFIYSGLHIVISLPIRVRSTDHSSTLIDNFFCDVAMLPARLLL